MAIRPSTSGIAALVLAAAAGCGRSPLVVGGGAVESSMGTLDTGVLDTGSLGTGGPTTTVATTTTATTATTTTDGSSTTTGPCPSFLCPPDLPPSPATCRDALECVLGCLGQGDPACIQDCVASLPPSEAQAMVDLVACSLFVCFQEGACMLPPDLGPDCFACVGIKLVAPEPTGCETEAAACQ